MENKADIIHSYNRWDRIYKGIVLASVLITTIVACIVLAQIYTVNNQIKTALLNGHKTNVQTLDQIKANQAAVDHNLRESLKCVLLLPRNQFDNDHLNTCFDNPQVIKK